MAKFPASTHWKFETVHCGSRAESSRRLHPSCMPERKLSRAYRCAMSSSHCAAQSTNHTEHTFDRAVRQVWKLDQPNCATLERILRHPTMLLDISAGAWTCDGVALPRLHFKKKKRNPTTQKGGGRGTTSQQNGAESHHKKMSSRFLVVVPASFAQKRQTEEHKKERENGDNNSKKE